MFLSYFIIKLFVSKFFANLNKKILIRKKTGKVLLKQIEVIFLQIEIFGLFIQTNYILIN